MVFISRGKMPNLKQSVNTQVLMLAPKSKQQGLFSRHFLTTLNIKWMRNWRIGRSIGANAGVQIQNTMQLYDAAGRLGAAR